MKRVYLSFAMWIGLITIGFSQFTFHVMGGVSPQSSPVSAGLIVNRQSPHEEFVFNMSEVGPQYFGGIKGQLELGSPFFLDFGLNYTKRKSTYELLYTMIDAEHPVAYHVMKESDHVLSLPVNVGVHMGAFDVTSGLRATRSIESRSDLDQLSGFAREENTMSIGWQGGIGFNMFDTRIGIEFDSQFSRIGKGMSVEGQSLELMNVPGQVIFTLQRRL